MTVFDVRLNSGSSIRVLSLDKDAAKADAELVLKSMGLKFVVTQVFQHPDSDALQNHCKEQGGHDGIARCAKICGYISPEYRERVGRS